MKLAVRTSNLNAVKLQLSSLMKLHKEYIIPLQSIYVGISLLDIDDNVSFSLSSIRNVDAILVEEEVARELLEQTIASKTTSFKSLDCVDEREQYEHLSQLLHIQKATRNKR